MERFYHSKLVVIAMFFLILFIGSKLVTLTERKTKVDEGVSAVTEEIQKLQDENNKLKASIELFSNPEFIKKEAKKRFNLEEPNEKLIIVPQR